MIDLLLLGTGGMLPLPNRWLSSLLVRCDGELTLFDCGEGTQIVWRNFGWGFRRVGAICFSHTHADHIAGLPGLFHTIANARRTDPLTVFGPLGIVEVVRGLRVIAPWLPYEVRVVEVAEGSAFPLPGGMTGRVAAGDHALPVVAYRVDLPRSQPFSAARAEALAIPKRLWRSLQAGEPVRWSEGAASPEDVLGPPRRGLSFGYVTDTRPVPAFPNLLQEVDLLVCEGTYGDPEDAPKARANQHMTFREAATLAAEARAGHLWITHFSPGLDEPEAFASEATDRFPATTIGFSGLQTTLSFAKAPEKPWQT